MKRQLLRLALAVPLLLLCAWPRTSVAQAAIAYAVVAWGNNSDGQTAVPVAAQSGVMVIAAGYFHTVALKSDGAVVAWGLNNFLQTTVPVAAQSGVTAIAAGSAHSVALKNDGAVVAWGLNNYGQTTVPVGAQSGVTAIAAGSEHSVALKSDGSVVAWGSNHYGQRTVPVAAQSGVTAIVAGYSHTVALKSDGSVVAWGLNDYGQTTVPVAAQTGVVAISAGNFHTLALKNDGSVVAWGYNLEGQVTGIPGKYSEIANPVTLGGQVLSGVSAIAAGGNHTVALKNDGSVVAWGWNYYDLTIPGEARSGVSAIAAGGGHTVALVIPTAPNITTQPVRQAVNVWQSASFTVVATGYLLNYQWRKDGVDLAGATSDTYTLPLAQTNQAGSYTVVVSNSVGSVTSAPPAVLTVNPAAAPGTVVAWGDNRFVQTTIPLTAQSGVVAVAASADHTVVLKDDGTVVAWGGDNRWGQSQTAVPIAARSGVAAIAAGGSCGVGCYHHTVALKDDGTVVAWRSNGEVTSPVTLGGQILSGVTAIAAGSEHTVALLTDGSVVAWGSTDPVPPAAQSGVTAIAAGSHHTVALKNDGTVVAWGYNRYGQVTGAPTNDEPSYGIASPVTLGGQVLSGVTAIAGGKFHSVALKNDGSVVAWGWNESGQTTVPLAAQSGVAAIAAGSYHTVALKHDATVVSWGNNGLGNSIASPVTLEGQALNGVTAIAAGHLQTVALIGGVKLLPSLQARPNGNELILSWPTNAPGFTLESTLDLTPPVTWLNSTSVPAVIGAHFTLTNSTSGGSRFYRLRKM